MKKILLLLILLILPLGIYANEEIKMDKSNYDYFYNESFVLGYKNLNDADVHLYNEKITFGHDNEEDEKIGYLYIVHNNEYAPLEASGDKPLAELTFRKVGKIDGKDIDCRIKVIRVNEERLWSGKDSTKPYSPFMMIFEKELKLGHYNINGSTVRRSTQEVDIMVEMLWSNNQNVIEYPFMQINSDIDINKDTDTDKTLESWQGLEGFNGNYYTYDTSNLTHDENWKWFNSVGKDVSGKRSYTVAGVYAETTNGRFSSRFTAGTSAAVLSIVSMYTNEEHFTPTKEAILLDKDNNEKEIVDSVGDKLNYTITQKIGKMFQTVFTPYKEMIIRDTIPNGLNYVKAIVKLNEEDITDNTDYGELSFNNATNELKYEFNKDWLKERSNYQGQTFTIEIETVANSYNNSYKNTVVTTIDNINYTNSVTNNSTGKSVTYIYQNVRDEMELPDEINTNTGNYKINDEKKYLIGETVNRINTFEVGTTYNIIDTDTEKKNWKLIEWDKDNEVVSDDITFTGYWEYVEEIIAPLTAKDISLIQILSFAVIFTLGLLYIIYTKKQLKYNHN